MIAGHQEASLKLTKKLSLLAGFIVLGGVLQAAGGVGEQWTA